MTYYGESKNGKVLVYPSVDAYKGNCSPYHRPVAVRWPFMLAFVVTLLVAVMAIRPF
jgi:hypothetical protein